MFWNQKLTFLLILIVSVCTVFLLFACAAPIVEVRNNNEFTRSDFLKEIPFATPDIIRLHEANLTKEYLIGPGDVIHIEFWNRTELSGDHTVGPYGCITLPMLGEFKIGEKNRTDAAKAIKEQYSHLYDDPIITVKILEYLNNKVYVLGRVTKPGVIYLKGQGTLLEALSLSGGLPTEDKNIFLSKCYIIRGKEQIIWVDLLQLLEMANLKLNISLANNDIIYIPDSLDAYVFVMGEVDNPGSYPIQTAGLSILDALNIAGGPTEDANLRQIRLIRDLKEQEGVKVVNIEQILTNGDFSSNFSLKDNDIVYVPRKGIAKFNYFLRQIDPFMKTFIDGSTIQNELDD
jgi:polysaccharide export outer membrane protein